MTWLRLALVVALTLASMVALPGAAGAQTNQQLLEELRSIREEQKAQRLEEDLLQQELREDRWERDNARQRERQEQRERERSRGFDCYRVGAFATCDPTRRSTMRPLEGGRGDGATGREPSAAPTCLGPYFGESG